MAEPVLLHFAIRAEAVSHGGGTSPCESMPFTRGTGLNGERDTKKGELRRQVTRATGRMLRSQGSLVVSPAPRVGTGGGTADTPACGTSCAR